MFHAEVERPRKTITMSFPRHDLLGGWVFITAYSRKKKEWQRTQARCFNQT